MERSKLTKSVIDYIHEDKGVDGIPGRFVYRDKNGKLTRMTKFQTRNKVGNAFKECYDREDRELIVMLMEQEEQDSPMDRIADRIQPEYDMTKLLPESLLQPTEHDVVVGYHTRIKKSHNDHYLTIINDDLKDEYTKDPYMPARAWFAERVIAEIHKAKVEEGIKRRFLTAHSGHPGGIKCLNTFCGIVNPKSQPDDERFLYHMFMYWMGIFPSDLPLGTLARKITTEPCDLAMLENFKKKSPLLRDHPEYVVYIDMIADGYRVSLDFF